MNGGAAIQHKFADRGEIIIHDYRRTQSSLAFQTFEADQEGVLTHAWRVERVRKNEARCELCLDMMEMAVPERKSTGLVKPV